jgi:uncharacterized membrane protein (UPF0127 family)
VCSCRGDAALGGKRPSSGDPAVVATGKAPSPQARGQVRFDTPRGPWTIDVEVARTPEARARGLMFRTDLPADTGMLFVFEETSEHGFWMHDTPLSLDLIFLDETRTTAGVVAYALPRTDTPRTIGKPSRYVVEVLAGEAAAHAVGPGVRAAFVGIDE